MSFEDVKASAEEILAGVEKDDWRGEAQDQARNVLGLVEASAKAAASHEQEIGAMQAANAKALNAATAKADQLEAEHAQAIAGVKNEAIGLANARASAAEAETAQVKERLTAALQAYAHLQAAAREAVALVEPLGVENVAGITASLKAAIAVEV